MTPSKRFTESSKPLTHGRRIAKYKEYDYSRGKFIPINFDKQILPGTFEYTLHYLLDNDLDLSAFDLCYKNDETGAPAYDPRILLKIVLYAYSKGITSSREIADCCNENVIFKRGERGTRVRSLILIFPLLGGHGMLRIFLFLSLAVHDPATQSCH